MSFWEGFMKGAGQAIDEQRAMGFKEREAEKGRQGDISKLITAGLIGGDVTQSQQGEEGAFGVPTAPMKPRNIGEAIMQGFGIKQPQAGQEYYKAIKEPKEWKPASMQEAIDLARTKYGAKKTKSENIRDIIAGLEKPEDVLSSDELKEYISKTGIGNVLMSETIPEYLSRNLGISKSEAARKSILGKAPATTGTVTPQQALNIISDPFKSPQVKRLYPDLYKKLEKLAKGALSEDSVNKDNLAEETNIMDTNW